MRSALIVARPTGKPAVAKPFESYEAARQEFRGVTLESGIVELWCSRRGVVKRNKFDLPEPVKPAKAKESEKPKDPEKEPVKPAKAKA